MPAECHRGGHEAENTLDSAKLDEINPVRKTDDVVGRRFNVWFSLASIKSAGGEFSLYAQEFGETAARDVESWARHDRFD